MLMSRLIMTAVFGCSLAGTANCGAALLKGDWKSPGDSLLLRDTATSLEWLRITESFNLSVNDLMGQWFGNTSITPLIGKFAEFRYATKEEVATLYGHFGIVRIDNVLTPDNWIGANAAFQALGISGSRLGVTVQEALSIDGPGVANSPEIVADGRLPKSARAFVFPTPTLTNFYDFDDKKPALGSYLVRDLVAVPVPSMGWLAACNFIGMGLLRRRIRSLSECRAPRPGPAQGKSESPLRASCRQ